MASANTYEPKNQKDFDLLSKLLEGISLRRFVKATPGTKIPGEKWKDVENHYPNEVGQNSLIRTGKGLMIIDVDKWEEVPQDLQDFLISHPTFTVQSPHAEGKEGHYYYKIDRAPFPKDSKKFGEEEEGGEYKHGALSVTPGSELTGCQHGCCSYRNPGEYRVRFDHPIRSVTVEDLPIGYDWSEWGDTGVTSSPSSSSPFPKRTAGNSVTWDDGLPDEEEYEALDLPDDYDGETVTNEFGMSMEQVREISRTIDRLCDDINPSNNYKTPSEADFHYCQSLYYWDSISSNVSSY